MHSRAQISLEFLLVMAIATVTMALMANAIGIASNRAFGSAELANAKLFASELSSSLRTLSVLSDGSSLMLKCEPLTEWGFSVSDDEIKISVNGNTLSVKSALELSADEKSFYAKGLTCLQLLRENTRIRISPASCELS